MKGYPLIYSRTKNFDFVPDFLARPKDLDCQLALKYVKNAMNNLDFVQNIRYTAFSVGHYCICGGIACISAKLAAKVKKSSLGFLTGDQDVEEYIRDCKGRNIACFIGIAIPKSEVVDGMIPDISLEKYWEIYLQYLKKQWFSESNTLSEQIEFPTIDIKEKRYVESFLPQKEIFGSRCVIKNYVSHEQQTLDYFFHVILSGSNDSVITEIQNREEWDALSFRTAVVSESLYLALKANQVSTSNVRSSLSKSDVFKEEDMGEVKIKRTQIPEPVSDMGSKKNSFRFRINPKIVIVGAVIILVIALAVKIKINKSKRIQMNSSGIISMNIEEK